MGSAVPVGCPAGRRRPGTRAAGVRARDHVQVGAAGTLDGGVEACRAGGIRVSVYCDPESAAAHAARERLPHALWGISIGGALSLTYCPGNPFAFWHETLHLLGAQDHYATHALGATTCELPSCIMQYAPCERTVGERPYICRRTRLILMKRAGRWGW